MTAVAAIAPVASRPAGQVVAPVVVRSTARVSASKPAAAPVPTAAASVAVSSQTQSLDPNLPLGLLMSVTEPASTNRLATIDYLSMRNDLASGNVAAAQQAYIRLQGDLELFAPASGLNTAA